MNMHVGLQLSLQDGSHVVPPSFSVSKKRQERPSLITQNTQTVAGIQSATCEKVNEQTKILTYQQKKLKNAAASKFVQENIARVGLLIKTVNLDDIEEIFNILFIKLPKVLNYEAHYHIFEWGNPHEYEALNQETLGRNLANIFQCWLDTFSTGELGDAITSHTSKIPFPLIQKQNWAHPAFTEVEKIRKWRNSHIAPLILHDTCIWLIELYQSDTFQCIPQIFLKAVWDLSGLVESYLLKINTYFVQTHLEEKNRKLQETQIRLEEICVRLNELSLTDQLTGLYHRRWVYDKLISTFLGKPNSTGAVISLDLDLFSDINERIGHQGGDAALKYVASKIRWTFENFPDVIIGRFGGDEFTILLPEMSTEDAYVLAEQLQLSISNSLFEYRTWKDSTTQLQVTTSIGISQYSNATAQFVNKNYSSDLEHDHNAREKFRNALSDKINEDLDRADTALYQVKMNWRDKAIVYKTGMTKPRSKYRSPDRKD